MQVLREYVIEFGGSYRNEVPNTCSRTPGNRAAARTSLVHANRSGKVRA